MFIEMERGKPLAEGQKRTMWVDERKGGGVDEWKGAEGE